MSLSFLGTILPTEASLAAGDRHAEEMTRRDAQLAAKTLAQCARRTVGGEMRYYATPLRYATVTRQRTRWFEVRTDGDYATG
jgi:hypothetical protein